MGEIHRNRIFGPPAFVSRVWAWRVTASTMSVAVRQRRKEVAVLETLGFDSSLVMTLILAEALLLGLVPATIAYRRKVTDLLRAL